VNFGNDFSRKFVGGQPAGGSAPATGLSESNQKRRPVNVDHCGGVSVWRRAAGGWAPFGEDAIEVARRPDLHHQCQARTASGAVGEARLPVPVPDTSRLKPRSPRALP
jgi:hypothetical protein